MVPDQSMLITVAGEQRGPLPKWGRTHDFDTEETYYVSMCTMVEDDTYGLDSDENGQSVDLCCTAEMSRVVLSEQRRMILDADRVTTASMRHRRCKASNGRQGRRPPRES
eukprot:5504123-Pyramimonas_sp.AAC.1